MTLKQTLWVLSVVLVGTACGYSEAEMQMQRDKSSQLERALIEMVEKCSAGGVEVEAPLPPGR